MTARRPGLRLVAALAAATLLPACWAGPALFTARDAVPRVLGDGEYVLKVGGSRESVDTLTVVNLPDGAMRVKADGGHDMRVIAVPLLGRTDRRFVLQMERSGERDDDATYMLLDARRDPVRLRILPCAGEVAGMLRRGGGTVSRDPNSGSSCQFHDRDLLRAQLRRFSTMEPDGEEDAALVPRQPR